MNTRGNFPIILCGAITMAAAIAEPSFAQTTASTPIPQASTLVAPVTTQTPSETALLPQLSPARSAMARVARRLNDAAAIRFDAIVSMPAKAGHPDTLDVSGEVAAPNLMDVTVRAAGAAPANVYLPARVTCDGTKYTAYSAGKRLYIQSSAPASGFESDSTDVGYFVYDVLKSSGAALLETANIVCPADFDLSDDTLPDGMKRTITTSVVDTTVNGVKCEDVQQNVTGAHGTAIYHTVIDSTTGDLAQWRVDKVKDGIATNSVSCTFRKLTLVSEKPAPTEFAAGNLSEAKILVPPALPGTMAPDFSVLTAKGDRERLADYRGKVVVLDFWATWCAPCRATLPSTDKLAARFQGQNVVFLPICTWDTKRNFDSWLTTHNTWTMPWVFDPAADNEEGSIASRLYAVSGIPTQYVIGKDGRILYRGYADTGAGEKPLIDAIVKAST